MSRWEDAMTVATEAARMELEGSAEGKSSYSDKRQYRRHRRRFPARFFDVSEGKEVPIAFTEDFSRQGLFIKTGKVPRIGTTIQITLTLPAGEVSLDGKVMWGKRVHPTLVNKMNKAGMGILITEFRTGQEIYLAACEELESR
jgi:Tfp pilus assembly protein PilZ